MAKRKRRILARVEKSLAGEPERLGALRDLVETVGARAVGSRIEFGAQDRCNLRGLIELTRWWRQWVRPLKDWRHPRSDARRAVFSSLANHLLARYPVPEFMAGAWWRRDDDGLAHRELYVHVARGNNPRTGPTPVPLTRRVAHHFLQAPTHCTIKGAVRWGQVMALGGTPALADACVATPLGGGFYNDAFWMSVIRWFIAHPGSGQMKRDPVAT